MQRSTRAPAAILCLASCLAAPLSAQWTLAPLTNPTPQLTPTFDAFGRTMASSTAGGVDWLFVGNGGLEDAGGFTSGGIHIYQRAHSVWLERQTTLGVESIPLHDNVRLDASGDLLVYSAALELFPEAGLRRLNSATQSWDVFGSLGSIGGIAGVFGTAVAVDGDLFAIADSVWNDPAFTLSANVRLYEVNSSGGTHVLQETVFPDFATGGIDHIASLDLHTDGSTVLLAVGAPTSFGGFPGAVYVYARDGAGVWSFLERIDPTAAGGFASDVAFDEDGRLVIGASGATSNGLVQAGVVYVYEDQDPSPTASNWTLIQELVEPGGQRENGNFGERVELRGGFLCLSARGSFSPVQLAAGIYLYEPAAAGDGSWDFDQALTTPAIQAGTDRLGITAEIVRGEVLTDVRTVSSGDRAVLRHALPVFDDEPGADSLQAVPEVLALEFGGAQCIRLDAGSQHAGSFYWLLGSASGTAPGIPVQGLLLPLGFPDVQSFVNYFDTTVNGPGGGPTPLVDALGVLDADGRATAQFNLAPGTPPIVAGLELYHAFVVFDLAPISVHFASNATRVSLEQQLPAEVSLLELDPPSPQTTQCCTTTTYTFTLSAALGSQPILSYTWDFGDGSFGVTTVPTVQHVYDSGSYVAVVSTLDAGGGITLLEIPIENKSEPSAYGVVMPVSANPGDTVTLSGGGSYDPDGGTIVSYHWSLLGQGFSATSPTLSFTIPVGQPGGTYLVELDVVDDEGSISTIPDQAGLFVL